MKKILSLVLVLSLVLGSMSMAFAAAPSFSDVEDETVLKAVLRLNAFGIVDGYDDGSYKPGKDITRAEFAKLLVTALGLENAADAATGMSQFTDVATGQWYTGAVSVAAGQGLVKGYADGTYKPDAEVKYSEAVTMLVRALGYQDEFVRGTWPNNYIAKAASLRITDDVKFQPNGFADRGSVAVLVNNTLDASIIEQRTFGDNDDWVENEHKTLLTERLNLDKYESIELLETPKVESGLDSDQVKFRTTDDSEMNAYEDDDFNLPSSFDVKDDDMLNALENRLGESLNVYADKDDIIFFEVAHSAYTVKWGTILSGDADKDDDEITVTFVDGDDKTYDYEDSGKDEIKIYVDNDEKDEDELVDIKGDLFGKFVISDNGDIALADLHDWDDEALIVKKASADKFDYIEAAGSDKDFEADDFDRVVVMNTAGQIMNMEDLKKDTVVYVNEAELAESGDDIAYVVAVETEAVVETAKSYDIDNNTADGEEFEFGTEENGVYDVNEKLGTVSSDEDDDFVKFRSASDELEAITDGEVSVQILFDIIKNIRHIRSDVDVSSTSQFAVILGADNDDFDEDEVQIKLLTASGDKEVYDLSHKSSGRDDDFENIYQKNVFGKDGSRTVTYTGEADLKYLLRGLIVKYTLNSDGDIDSLIVINEDNDGDNVIKNQDDELAGNEDADKTFITSGVLKEDIEKDSIEFKTVNNGGDVKDFTVASDVVVFDITDAGYDDMEVVKFDKLIGNGSGKTILVVGNDDEEAELVVVTNAVASEDEYVAYVLDTYEKNGDPYFKMAVFGEDEVKRYEVDADSVNVEDIAEQSMVVFKMKSDDTIKIVEASDKDADVSTTSVDFKFVVGQVVGIDGDYLKIDTDGNDEQAYEEKVKLDEHTIMYKEGTDDIDVDEYDFVLVAKDGTRARIVKRYDIDYDDFNNGDDTKMFKEDFGGSLSGLYYGDGEPGSGGTVAEGTIKYVGGTDGNIVIDDDTYALSNTTVLKNLEGTVVAVGKTNIGNVLDVDDTVKDVVVEDGVVKSLVGVSIASEKTAAKVVTDAIAALAFVDPANPTGPEKTAVSDARTAYDGLTDSRQDLVTNLADLVAAEKVVSGTDDIAAAADVDSAIEALPSAASVATTDKVAIEAARTKFDALTAAQEALVKAVNVTKLTDVEAALKVAVAVKAVNDATTVSDMITAIEDEDLGLDLTEYNALLGAQKDIVAQYVIDNKGGGYADKAAIQAALDAGI